MKMIFKYVLDVTDRQIVNLPQGAEILTVQVQHESVALWALVDPSFAHLASPKVVRMYGTGHDIFDEGRYLDTVQVLGGSAVFHVFVEAE